MSDSSGKASIKPVYLLIALLPAIVFVGNQIVLQIYAEPWDVLPERVAEFDAYKESAGRIAMLAGFILFMGAASAAILFFLYTLRMLAPSQRGSMIAAFLALAAAAVLIQGREATDYMGNSLVCLAAGYDEERSRAASAKERIVVARARVAVAAAREEAARVKAADAAAPEKAAANAELKAAVKELETATREREAAEKGEKLPEGPARPATTAATSASPPSVAVEHLPRVALPCASSRFQGLGRLMLVQFVAMALAFAGLVFGALCCLAQPNSGFPAPAEPGPTPVGSPAPAGTPGGFAGLGGLGGLGTLGTVAPPPPDPALQYWERQSVWLNTYLYLSALLLGTGLLFVGAFLRWPSFLLVDPKGFEAHVGAMLSYYGFTFTVMLAAFYIPVATILAGRVQERVRATGGAAKLPEAFKGPVQVLKIVLGLVSPTLVGVVPQLLGFGG